MSDEVRDADLESRLDEAFASMRPRTGFEDELLERIQRGPVVVPARRTSWWTWTGAAAAVVLVGAFAFLFAHAASPHQNQSSAAGRGAADASLAARPAAFGPLPRPSPSAAVVDPAFAPEAVAGVAVPEAASALPTDATVVRYREPAAADNAALAGRLGANGSGARYSSPDLTLVFFPTDPAHGLPAHYVLTVSAASGPPPPAPAQPEAAQRAASDFLTAHSLPAGSVVNTSALGPLAVVRYSSGTAVYVRGDLAVAQVTGLTGVGIESSGYPLAAAGGLQKAAGQSASPGPRLATVLVSDGAYWYLEPVAVFGSVAVPAVDPAYLR